MILESFKAHSEYIKLTDLTSSLEGEYLFVYSDNINIFVLFFNHVENKLQKITTNKCLTVEDVCEITIPDDFNMFDNIIFFRPRHINNSIYEFTGIIQFSDGDFKFSIGSNNSFVYLDEVKYNQPNGIINTLTCLDEIDIISYIQKKNKIYLIGYDEHLQNYVLAIANIEDNKLERIYSMSTEYGDMLPQSLTIDINESRIYVVGSIDYIDGENKVKPFLECFVLI